MGLRKLLKDTDSKWVQAVPGRSSRKYNLAWRKAVMGACAIRTKPAPYRIYVVTNRLTGKQYVGGTKRLLSERWHRHKTKDGGDRLGLAEAIRTYGAENFELRVLSEALNLVASRAVEAFWVRTLNTLIPNGYNATPDGQSGYWSSASNTKRRKTQKRRMQDPARREHLRTVLTPLQRRRAAWKAKRTKRWKQVLKSRLGGFYGA